MKQRSWRSWHSAHMSSDCKDFPPRCCLVYFSVLSVLVDRVCLWFQRGLHSLCPVRGSMSFLSLGEGRTLSVDFSSSRRVLVLFLWLLLLVSEEHLLCCLAFPCVQGGQAETESYLGFSRDMNQGCEVTVSLPGPFSGCHTPEGPGPPCRGSVFRCSSTCPIASSKLGHTKQTYWH